MIYRVMSVCWKACGARLLSSQRERRGGKKKIKTNRKLLLAFVFKGNSPPVCILPGRLFLNQHLQAKSDAAVCCGSWAERGDRALWENPGQLLIHDWAPLFWKRLLAKCFLRVFSDTAVEQVFSLTRLGFQLVTLKTFAWRLRINHPLDRRTHLLRAFLGSGEGWGGDTRACKLNKREAMGCWDSGPG